MWAGETEKPVVALVAIWIFRPFPFLVSLYQNLGIATIAPPVLLLLTIPAQGWRLSNGELHCAAVFPAVYGTGSVKPAASSVLVHLVVLLPSQLTP